MLYIELAELYEKLEATTKRLEKTFLLANFLKKAIGMFKQKKLSEEQLKDLAYLVQGKIMPTWSESEIGISSQLIIKCISKATGINEEQIVKLWKEVGDLGKVAETASSKKKQVTLFSKALTASKVIENLRKASKVEGEGSVDKKIMLVAELLTNAQPKEARYIVRTILEELRIGVGEGIVRDAIVQATMPIATPLFVKCKNCNAIVPQQNYCVNCQKQLDAEALNGDKLSYEEVVKLIQHKKQLPNVIVASSIDEARKIYQLFIDKVQEAYDISADFGEVLIKAARSIYELDKIELKPGKPVKVMLALKASNIEEAFSKVGKPAQIEYKYDGFRVLIHKSKDGKIKIFTRRLEDVTKQFPEIVQYVKQQVNAESFIIDGEAVGYDPKTKKYRPFQEISQRIKRKYHIAEMAKELPVEVHIFDILYLNGKSTIKLKFGERRKLIEKIIKPVPYKLVLAKKCVTSSVEEAEAFYNEALDNGQEGVMFKNLEAPYKPGARVGYMLKLKPEKATLDLVIVGAEWGTGKRSGWLSSFVVACYDSITGRWLTVGKVGTGVKEKEATGLTFEQLTEMLKPLIIEEKGREVKIKPQVVVEVMYQEIQKSPTYESGYALRFPRIIRLRPDKAPEEADTIDTIIKYYKEQGAK